MRFNLSFTLLAGMLILSACSITPKDRSADPWQKANQIVESIQSPVIPQTDFRITEFGGSGDGIFDNKPVFDSLIAQISSRGGGRMVVPAGTYRINGPLHLKSNMELHLEEGAILKFGNDPTDYLPMVLTSWEGTRCYNYSPFIYVHNAHDVAITGNGTIDGEGADPWNRWKDLQDPDKKLLRTMNNEGIPLDQRRFGEGHFLRPHLIQFYECENILVEDVKITDSPFWCLHFVFSREITVRGITYEAFNFNNDGIDPESSENVLIENVLFNNRDDNIAIKAGRDREARELGRPSRNIVVRDCRFKGHNAIAVGSEMSGGVNNIFVENCSYAGKVMYGFYLKGNRDRGGVVEHIYARNIAFDTTRSTLIIDSNYKNQGSCCPPLFKNIFVEELRSNHASDHGIYIKGFGERPLDSLYFRDVQIKSARIPLEVTHTNHLVMEDITINGKEYSGWREQVQWIREPDPKTGREVRQITDGQEPSVACYFERQAFTADEKYVVCASMENGEWVLIRTNLETGEYLRITPPDRYILEDDYTVMPDGRRVNYLDGWKLYATDMYTLKEEVLYDFTGKLPGQPWFTGSFTNDGIYTLVYVREDSYQSVYRVNLETGKVVLVHRRTEGRVSHAMINPADPDVITYVPGPDTQNDMSLPMDQRARTWKVDLKEGVDQQFVTMPYGFRATHESWTKDGQRFYFYRKTRPGWSPVSICSIDKQGGDWQVHYSSVTIKLGHGITSNDGRWFITDSQDPGSNELILINLETGAGEVLCWPNSSAAEGNTTFTHVHPSFSPSGKYVCFTSDRTGVSQFYVVPVGDLTQPDG